jgi:hypothetical protein
LKLHWKGQVKDRMLKRISGGRVSRVGDIVGAVGEELELELELEMRDGADSRGSWR